MYNIIYVLYQQLLYIHVHRVLDTDIRQTVSASSMCMFLLKNEATHTLWFTSSIQDWEGGREGERGRDRGRGGEGERESADHNQANIHVHVYVRRKVRIRTILGFSCANFGS